MVSTSSKSSLFLVFGGSGGTGKHFIRQALSDGHRVRALVRTPSKLPPAPHLEIIQGSTTEPLDTDFIVKGVKYVCIMLGDKYAQSTARINTAFMKQLIPSMRREGVKRILYLAGALSKPYGSSLPPILWIIRYGLITAHRGQHQDNEAVMEYLATEGNDMEWIVHRAGIGGDGPTKGRLVMSTGNPSVGTHVDCADYDYRMLVDETVARRCDISHYQ